LNLFGAARFGLRDAQGSGRELGKKLLRVFAPGAANARGSKSFLVLFFKKEPLELS
jgi:hypothetical protein